MTQTHFRRLKVKLNISRVNLNLPETNFNETTNQNWRLLSINYWKPPSIKNLLYNECKINKMNKKSQPMLYSVLRKVKWLILIGKPEAILESQISDWNFPD